MPRSFPRVLFCVSILCACLRGYAAPPQNAEKTATIRRIGVLGQSDTIEIQIAARESVSPQTQVLTEPNRVVIDFPGAIPGAKLRPVVVNKGAVKAVRVGLFKSNPPVTRVVLDLKVPQPFQLLSSRDVIIVQLGAAGSGATSDIISPQGGLLRPIDLPRALRAREIPVHVSFDNGLLSVVAEKATLAQVLLEVQHQTGAEIEIPPDAEHQEVVANIGPAPAKQVLAELLKGTHYNFILVGYDIGPGSLQRVILTRQSGGLPAETDVSSEPSQAALIPTIEPQPSPAGVLPLPDGPADQNSFPPYGLQYSPWSAWAAQGQLPQIPQHR